MLSQIGLPFLRSGQAVNFARPESKFLVPCAQIPSFLFDNAKVRYFSIPLAGSGGLARKFFKYLIFFQISMQRLSHSSFTAFGGSSRVCGVTPSFFSSACCNCT